MTEDGNFNAMHNMIYNYKLMVIKCYQQVLCISYKNL